MEKCISCGRINKYYGYIFLSVLFMLLQDLAYGTNYNNSFRELIIFKLQNEHKIIHDVFCYLVVFFSSLVIYKKYKIKKPKNILINKAKIIQDQKEEEHSKKYFTKLLFIIILWAIEEQLKQLYMNILKNLDFWMFELIIMYFFMKRIFNVKLYKHQILSFLIIIFPFIFKVGTIILSIISHDNNDPGIIYLDNKFIIPIGIILYIILLISDSYILTEIKSFMDIRFISIPEILMYFGLFGSIICLIITLASSYIECPHFQKDICDIPYIENNKTIYYFENYKIYFSGFKENPMENIAVNLIGNFSFFLEWLFSLLVVKHLSPIHKIFSTPFYFFSQKTLLAIITLCKEQNFFAKNKIRYILWKFILDITGDFIAILALMVYLEIIELNFCEFNHDTRKSIAIRAIDDILSDSKEKDFIFLQNGDVEEISNGKNKKRKNFMKLLPN